MCGIYGQAQFTHALEEPSCRRKLAMLSHRGPDHSGTYSLPRLFLGHARLSILDLSAAAHQPFGNEHGRLVFNGEIYNYLSLRTQLSPQNWETHSDTEVLFQLLQTKGVETLPLLNGMFAFAYWDAKKNTLLLARDRVGIKPLYYRLFAEGIEFASEIKAFEITPHKFEALKAVLARGNWGRGALPFEGVSTLAPGHFLEIDLNTGVTRIRSFLTLSDQVKAEKFSTSRSFSALELELEERLEKSVALHLQSDTQVGSLCSGGIDSSLVSALALRHRKDVPLYHCGIKGGGGEEHHAVTVAKALGVDLVVERITADTFLDLLPLITWHLDQPLYFANDVGLYLIAKRAKQDGIKVLLCGEGADELLGGYTWHQSMLKLMQGQGRLNRLGPTARKIVRKLHGLLEFALGRPHYTFEEMERYAGFGLCYPAPGIDRIYKGDSFTSEDFEGWKRWDAASMAYQEMASPEERAVQALLLDNMGGHLLSILHRTDRILMANSIEGRVPFLENEMIDFCLNLPFEAKIRKGEGKALLKNFARKHLPKSIVDRPKMGFPIPWENYLPRHPQLLKDGFVMQWSSLTYPQLQAFYQDDVMLRFRMLAIEIWGRLFVYHENPASIQVR